MISLIQLVRRALSKNGNVTTTDRAIRHLIVGGIGTLAYLACVAFLVEYMSVDPVLSVIFCFGFLQYVIYSANRKWVYESTLGHLYALPRFGIVILVSWILNAGVMYVVVDLYGWWYVWGLIMATAIVPVTNFVLNTLWAFR